jgi:hypothetical protein
VNVELQHDRELVEMMATTAEGNAWVHRQLMGSHEERRNRTAWSQHEMLAASGFIVAASYWSLIDARKAVELYATAAETYRQLDHEYWIVAALAAGPRQRGAWPSRSQESLERSPQTVAFEMLWRATVSSDERTLPPELETAREHFGNVPVGRLRIPLYVYGRCAEALRERDVHSMSVEAPGYVARAAEVIEAASRDHLHWQSLRTAILPAEPEAVATIASFARVARELHVSLPEMTSNLGEHARRLVAISVNVSNESAPPQLRPLLA